MPPTPFGESAVLDFSTDKHGAVVTEERISQDFPQEDPKLFLAPTTLRNCAVNLLIPGMGYWLTGRKRSWIVMTAALAVAYLFAILLSGDLYSLTGESKIRSVGAVCQMGMGIPYFFAKLIMSRSTPLDLTYDYGTNYFLLAGMINWLATLDIFDISVKRK